MAQEDSTHDDRQEAIPGRRVLAVFFKNSKMQGEEPFGGVTLAEFRTRCEKYGAVEKISCMAFEFRMDAGDPLALVQYASDDAAFEALRGLNGFCFSEDGHSKVVVQYSNSERLLIQTPSTIPGQRIVRLHIRRLHQHKLSLGGLTLQKLHVCCSRFGTVQKLACSQPSMPVQSLNVLVQFAAEEAADAVCRSDEGFSLTEDGFNCVWAKFSDCEELTVLPGRYPDRMCDFTARDIEDAGDGPIALDIMPRQEPSVEEERLARCTEGMLDERVHRAVVGLAKLQEAQRPRTQQALRTFLQHGGQCRNVARAFVVDPVEVLQVLCDTQTIVKLTVAKLAVEILVKRRPSENELISLKACPADLVRVQRAAQRFRAESSGAQDLATWSHNEAFVSILASGTQVAEKLIALQIVKEIECSDGKSKQKLVYNLPVVEQPTEVAEEHPECVEVESFDYMDLKENLLRGIYSYGFEIPSLVQKRAIKPIVDGRHTIIQASAGTGKTAVFTIGALQRVNTEHRDIQALVLAPGRELVLQLHKVCIALAEYLDVKCYASVGGTSVRDDIKNFRAGQTVVYGTPGRIFDMISKRHLKTDGIRLLVIDEADALLSDASKRQVLDIRRCLPRGIQVVLCSTTMCAKTIQTMEVWMPNPAKILVPDRCLLPENIVHFFVDVEKEEWKSDTLCDLYEILTIRQTLVFVGSRRKVDWLEEIMIKRDLSVSVLHGDMDQTSRDLVVREFRSGLSTVLLTTDITSRGLDVQAISVVLNYDVPNNPENYMHQVGRAGRFGRKGVAITFVTESDRNVIRDIEARYSIEMTEMPMDIANMV
mmetsp:Transcript_58101/g.189183  ORF Transcript_58101/g.189183 Transcript_58101/m.189183 type:complete len:822 (-) Transcript_58101:226-2691(-)